jgi:hypothetical protein
MDFTLKFHFIYFMCCALISVSGIAWIGYVQKANDVHPIMECSNKGVCDRETGTCECFPNFEGIACERTVCLNECSMSGVCYTARQLAEDAGRVYETPWDANKNVGCVCDLGFRGPDCSYGMLNNVLVCVISYLTLYVNIVHITNMCYYCY